MIRSKHAVEIQIKNEYQQLVRTEHHNYAVTWISIKLNVSLDYVNEVINK